MLVYKNTAGASAITPPSGKTTLFVDAAGVPSTKDDAGVVVQLLTETEAGGTYQPLNANLTGISGVTFAADQSAYYTGSAWAAYTVTSVGRTLLAQATQAAQRTAIQAVGTVGDEAIGGVKTLTGTQLRMQSASPGFWLDESDGSFGMYTVFDASNYQIQQRDGGFGGNPVIRFYINLATSQSAIDYNFGPRLTNTYSCGTATRLWTQIFATNATISTSDARAKTEPRQLRQAEVAAFSQIARLPAIWRWLSRVNGDGCEPEGREARKHGGPTVQAAMAIMEAHGLDPMEYACFCYDQWEAQPEQWHEWPEEVGEDGEVIREAGRELVQEAVEAGDRYSFRKEELLCLIVSAMAAQHDALEARVAALEAGRTP